MEKITFFTDGEASSREFYVIEQTVLHKRSYLLVSDLPPEDEDALAFIFRETRRDGDDVIYEPVENEKELDAVSGIFRELLSDSDIDFVR